MGFIQYILSLPKASKYTLLAGLIFMGIGMTGSRWAQDLSWIKFFDNVHWTAGIVASAVFAWLNLGSVVPARLNAYKWIATGLTSYAIGELLWGAQILADYSAFPGPADFFFLMMAPCFSIGLLLDFFRLAKPGERTVAILDILTLVVAIIALVFAVYLPERGETTTFPFLIMGAYPIVLLSTISIAMVMTLELRLRLNWQWMLSLTSIFMMGAFWLVWNHLAFKGNLVDGTWFNIIWSVFHLTLGVGLVSWQVEQSDNGEYHRLCEGLLRLLPLMAVVMACLAILLATGLDNVSDEVMNMAKIAAPMVILLAVIRQVLKLSEREQLIATQAALVREEETVRVSEERFRTLTLATTQIVWTTNALGEVVYDLPSWRAYTGQGVDEIKGWGWIKALHPDDVERTVAIWKQSVETRSIYLTEYRIRRYDGVYRHFSVRGVPVYENTGGLREWVGTCTDITEIKQSEDLIWKQANYDALTGLPNRHMLLDRLEQEFKKSDRAGLPLAFLLIDLDQFKEVNDTLGHEVGDMLLKQAAQRISDCVRDVDTVARLGGDEFVVILSDLSDDIQAEEVAQKIINRMADPYYLGNEVAFVSASIGITMYPNDTIDISSLMKNADQAMYVAKSKGRNCFSYFTKGLQESAQTRMHLTNDMRGALSDGQFRVYLQPIVELSTGHIHKAEALLRWQHPTHGMIHPMAFIPLAETSGLINEIGDWVFKQSADWVSRWNMRGAGEFQISVNMSPVQFNSRINPTLAWGEYLDTAGLSNGGSIVVEITEGLLLNAESNVMDQLLTFQDIGIEVAIDDFGTGYSALSYLKKFHIDYLKIDQSFTKNLETDVDNVALCEAIIVMAHKLGLSVIAEGVETEGQRNMLLSMGCDYGQGYLFAKPMPDDVFVKYLELEKSL